MDAPTSDLSKKPRPGISTQNPRTAAPAENPTAPASDRHQNAVAVSIIALGVLFRLSQYLSNRSLWLDEAMLALNIVNRPFSRLFEELDNIQIAPQGFLLVERFFVVLLGNNEFALRLFPFLCGCLALPLMYDVSRRCISGTPALFVLALFAASEPLIYFASELKPYSTDVAVCLLLYAIADRHWDAASNKSRFGSLAIAGAVGIWFSFPVIFVLSGIGISLALHHGLKRDKPGLMKLLLVFVCWAVSFGISYWISLRFHRTIDVMLDYWQSCFLPWHDWMWPVRAVKRLYENPVGLSRAHLAVVLAFLGSLSLLVWRWKWAVALLLPSAFALIASGFQKYPFCERLMLFAAPSFLILLGAGLKAISRCRLRWSGVSAGLSVFLAGALLYNVLISAIQRVGHPTYVEHIKPAMLRLQQQAKDTDFLYVYYGSKPAFDYYSASYALKTPHVVKGKIFRANPEQYISELEALKGQPRVWLLFSHGFAGKAGDERELVLRRLDQFGKKLEALEGSDSYLYLYDLRPGVR